MIEGRGIRFAVGCRFGVFGESVVYVLGDGPSNNIGQKASLTRGQRLPPDFSGKTWHGRRGGSGPGGARMPGRAGGRLGAPARLEAMGFGQLSLH